MGRRKVVSQAASDSTSPSKLHAPQPTDSTPLSADATQLSPDGMTADTHMQDATSTPQARTTRSRSTLKPLPTGSSAKTGLDGTLDRTRGTAPTAKAQGGPPTNNRKNATRPAAGSVPAAVQATTTPRKPRRTKAEMAEAKVAAAAEKAQRVQAKADAAKMKTQLEEKTERQLEEMERRDQLEMAKRATHLIRRLSQTEIPPDDAASAADVPEPTGQEMDIEGDEASDDEVEVVEGDEASEEQQREIEELTARLQELKFRAGIVKTVKKVRTQGNTEPLASGLRNEFKATRTTAPAAPAAVIGGLDDDDISDTPPTDIEIDGAARAPPLYLASRPAAPGERDVSRKNTLVAFLPSPLVASQVAAPIKSSASKLVPQIRKVTPKMPPTQRDSGRAQNHVQKVEKHYRKQHPSPSPAPTARESEIHDGGATTQSADKVLTAASVRIRHLPEFARLDNKYRELLLPTLYQILYTSTEPFRDFVVSTPNLNARVQQAVDVAYTTDYEVKLRGDPIHLMSYNRLNDRRTQIADEAVELVGQHVKTFLNLSEKHAWLTWAQRLTGPLFFEEPTPAFCTAKPGEPQFIEPSGRMKSVFMLTMLRNALKQSENSVLASTTGQPPLGLIGLVMAALHRAARIVQADGTKRPGAKSFSALNYNDKVLEFVRGARGVTAEKWAEVLESLELTVTSDEEVYNEEDSIADAGGYDVFAFASPKKRRT